MAVPVSVQPNCAEFCAATAVKFIGLGHAGGLQFTVDVNNGVVDTAPCPAGLLKIGSPFGSTIIMPISFGAVPAAVQTKSKLMSLQSTTPKPAPLLANPLASCVLKVATTIPF